MQKVLFHSHLIITHQKNILMKIDKGKISRYAWGKDYHLVIWQKLDELETDVKRT